MCGAQAATDVLMAFSFKSVGSLHNRTDSRGGRVSKEASSEEQHHDNSSVAAASSSKTVAAPSADANWPTAYRPILSDISNHAASLDLTQLPWNISKSDCEQLLIWDDVSFEATHRLAVYITPLVCTDGIVQCYPTSVILSISFILPCKAVNIIKICVYNKKLGLTGYCLWSTDKLSLTSPYYHFERP